jgi:hypothetical protein
VFHFHIAVIYQSTTLIFFLCTTMSSHDLHYLNVSADEDDAFLDDVSIDGFIGGDDGAFFDSLSDSGFNGDDTDAPLTLIGDDSDAVADDGDKTDVVNDDGDEFMVSCRNLCLGDASRALRFMKSLLRVNDSVKSAGFVPRAHVSAAQVHVSGTNRASHALSGSNLELIATLVVDTEAYVDRRVLIEQSAKRKPEGDSAPKTNKKAKNQERNREDEEKSKKEEETRNIGLANRTTFELAVQQYTAAQSICEDNYVACTGRSDAVAEYYRCKFAWLPKPCGLPKATKKRDRKGAKSPDEGLSKQQLACLIRERDTVTGSFKKKASDADHSTRLPGGGTRYPTPDVNPVMVMIAMRVPASVPVYDEDHSEVLRNDSAINDGGVMPPNV